MSVEAVRIARTAGIELTLDGNDLLLAASSEPASSIIEGLRLHKPEIVELLQSEHDRFEPRQNTVKSKLYGEVLARLRSNCPEYVDLHRWQQAIRDADNFLARWGMKAEPLGWTEHELFGLHRVPERPAPFYSRLSRLDDTGLLWLLRGRPVVTLTATEAAYRCASGAHLTYRKQNKLAPPSLSEKPDDVRRAA
jgi:hypothetical protein